MGRRPRVPIGRVGQHVVAQAARFRMLATSPSSAAARRRWQVFRAFCAANDLHPTEDFAWAVYLWVAAARCAKPALRWSTIAVYLRQVRCGYVRSTNNGLPPDLSELLKYIDGREAASDALHALDISLEQALHLVDRLPDDRLEKVVACLMLCCGLRCADICRLLRKQIVVTADVIRIQVRVAKNRRTPRERVQLEVPWAWCGPSAPARRAVALVRTFLRETPEQYPFARASLPILNGLLSAASAAQGLEDAATTYSLRRCYLDGVIRRFTTLQHGASVVNWQQVLPFTLHFEDKTLQAHYQRF